MNLGISIIGKAIIKLYFIHFQEVIRMKFYEKTWFIVLMLILFFPVGLILMWRFGKFSVPQRIIITVLLLLFFGWIFTGEEKISAEQCKQNIDQVKAQLTALQNEYDELTLDIEGYKEEIATLTNKVESADKITAEKVKDAEDKIRKESEEEIKKAIAEVEKRADEEIAAAKAKADQQVAAAVSEAKAQIDENNYVAAETETAASPQFFQNCTDLRGTHPGGVPSNHPDYQPKMDRDKDGWACE